MAGCGPDEGGRGVGTVTPLAGVFGPGEGVAGPLPGRLAEVAGLLSDRAMTALLPRPDSGAADTTRSRNSGWLFSGANSPDFDRLASTLPASPSKPSLSDRRIPA